MATNWSGYEAAKEILEGNNTENISEIGSRFPLFARTVAFSGSEQLLDILKALPKVTARVIETGLNGIEDTEEEAPKKKAPKKKAESEEVDDFEEEAEDEETAYESMTGKDLYALCCKRGISSLCKSRKKDDLIELLEKLDNGEIEPSKGKAKAEPKKEAKKSAKKAEPVEEAEDDDWGEEEEDTDPYAGKSAMELFKMCQKRGIKTKPKQKADAYVKLLKKADEAEAEDEETEDEDDDWEI